MRILAIDPGSHKTGLAFYDNKVGSDITTKLLDFGSKKLNQPKLKQIFKALSYEIKKFKPDLIFIELPFSKSRYAAEALSAIRVMVKIIAEAEVKEISPTVWRKALTIKTKQQAIEFGSHFSNAKSEDEAEAAAILIAGRKMMKDGLL